MVQTGTALLRHWSSAVHAARGAADRVSRGGGRSGFFVEIEEVSYVFD